VASGWWDPVRNSVGASGAIFGVYGALLAFFALRRADFPVQLWKSIGTSALIFCGYSLAVGAASPMIDNAAHVGGLLGGFVSGWILVRPFTLEARSRPQPLRLALAVVAVLLPLLWIAKPLLDPDQSTRRGFILMLHEFEAVDAASMARQAEILAQRREGEESAPLAKQLREEVLAPWRRAAMPVLDARDLPNDGSPEARLQPVIREYVRAKERALSLTALALQSGDPETFESAQLAWQRVGQVVKKLGTDRSPGT
jgi:rhomboid protease GluP